MLWFQDKELIKEQKFVISTLEYCVRKERYEEIKQSVYDALLWNLIRAKTYT